MAHSNKEHPEDVFWPKMSNTSFGTAFWQFLLLHCLAMNIPMYHTDTGIHILAYGLPWTFLTISADSLSETQVLGKRNWKLFIPLMHKFVFWNWFRDFHVRRILVSICCVWGNSHTTYVMCAKKQTFTDYSFLSYLYAPNTRLWLTSSRLMKCISPYWDHWLRLSSMNYKLRYFTSSQ